MGGYDLSTKDLVSSLEGIKVHDHLCYIHENGEEQRLSLVACFLEIGLRRGEKVVCIQEKDFSDRLRDFLERSRGGIRELIASGALFFSSPEEVSGNGDFSPEAMLSYLEKASSSAMDEGYAALRLIVEIPKLPDNRQVFRKLLEYESRLSSSCAAHPAVALCQYKAEHLPPEIIPHLVSSHPGFVFAGKICRNRLYSAKSEDLDFSESAISKECSVASGCYENIVENEKAGDHGDHFQQLIDRQVDGIIIVDLHGRILFVNPAACELFGVSSAEMVGRNFGLAAGERSEIEILRPGRKSLSVDMRAVDMTWYGEKVSLVSLRDMTGRKENEDALSHANRALRILTGFRRLLFHAEKETDLLDSLCRLIIHEADYRMVWIGYAREGEKARPVARAGRCEEHGPSLSLPLVMKPGKTFGTLNIYAAEGDDFNGQEVYFLKELANDLAYGIRHLRLQREKARTESELARSEAYSNTIIENSLDLITIVGSEGTVHYQSPSSKEILGYRPEEITGRGVFTFVHPEDREKSRKAVEKVLNSTDSSHTSELRIKHRDGSWRNMESITTFIEDQDNTPQVLINSRDITARILTEKELRKKAHALGGRVRELNCLFSVISILLDHNKKMDEAFTEIVDLIPDSLQYPESACARLIFNEQEYRTKNFQLTHLRAGSEIRLDNKLSGLVEFCYLLPEGEESEPEIPAEERDLMNAIARQIEGAIFRYQMQGKLRNSEEKYRTLYETMAQGVVYQDVDGLIVSANPAAMRILGLTLAKLESRDLDGIIFQAVDESGSFRPLEKHPAMIALSEGREVSNSIIKIFNPIEKGYRWISINAVPQWRPGEESPYRVSSTFEDITELKKTSDELSYRVSLEQLLSEISTRFINLPLELIDKEINRALAVIGRFVGVDRSYVFLLSEDGATMSNTHEWCSEKIGRQNEFLRNISTGHYKWWMEKLSRFKPIVISNVEEMPEAAEAERKFLGKLDVRALLCVPMTYGGWLKGFLGFDLVGEKKVWSAQDVSLLRMLGEVVILALQHKKAEEQLELAALRKIRETFLGNFRRLCRDAREEEPIFEAATSWLTNHLRVERGSISLLEEDSRPVFRKYYFNEGEGFRRGAEGRVDVIDPYLKSLRISDSPLIIEDAGKGSLYPAPIRRYLELAGIGALLIIPFRISKNVCGFLFFEKIGDARPWPEDELKLVKGVADQIAMAYDRIRERRLRRKQRREYTEELENRVVQRTMELEEAKKAAEAASLAKSEFLANMSHELRTPLNSVLGFAEIIRDNMAGPTTEQQREYLNDIMESGKHLLDLINDVLDLSKVEAGAMELELETIQLGDFFEHCLTMFREKALKHAIGLRLKLADEINKIVADRRKLMQVVINLLSNALKFTPEGGEVGIRTDLQGGHLLIEVWDTGIGMTENDRKRLFQPFQQLESGRSRKYQGTGLGLSLCKNIVKLHGGNIGAESVPGQGSSFMVSIPVDPLHSEEEVKAEGKNISPILQVQGLKFGIHNLDRILVLHKNWELRFGLFNLKVHEVGGINEIVSLADVLRRGMRCRDTIIYDHMRKSYFLILSGLEVPFAEDNAVEFINYLRNEGYEGEGRLVFFPDEGRNREELLNALAGKKMFS